MRNTKRRGPVHFFNLAMIAAPVVAAAGYLFYLGVIAPRESREIVNAFRVRSGQSVPAVTLADTTGARFSLAQAVLGRPALVIVMNPTCTHCHTELQAVQAIMGRTPPAQRPRVVIVSVGQTELHREAARTYAGLPVYDDVAGAIQGRLGLRMVPASFTVAGTGEVMDVRVGLQSEAYLAGALASLTR